MLTEEKEWVTDRKEVEEVWAKAFEKLGTEEKNEGKFDEKFAEEIRSKVKRNEESNLNLEDVIDQPITIQEVTKAIKKLKRDKAVGIDNYMNEIFMYGGKKITEATWKLCNQIFNKETYPKSWAKGLIFPLFKGGSYAF